MILTLSSPTYATNVSREKFLAFFSDLMPPRLCKVGSGFRDCYAMTEEECLKNAEAAVASCIDEIKGEIPDPVTGKDDGKKWGAVIGQCAGGKMVMLSAKLAKNTSQERTACLKNHTEAAK